MKFKFEATKKQNFEFEQVMSLTRPAIILACLAFVSAAIATPTSTRRVLHAHSIAPNSGRAQRPSPADTRLSGDWDYYVMLGAAPNGGFEARRRMGFTHFDGPSANGAWFKRRSAAPLYTITKVNEVEAFSRLPVIAAAESAGCPRPQYWNDWFDHQKDDAYWRARSIERRLDRVKVPVLGIAGWHDDARGTIRNYEVMSRLRHLQGAPPYHVVMDAGAHKGIDYVNGYFGPQARIDRRELQLRWMDHYLKGIDNGVDVQAPFDIFVIGDNTWRKERGVEPRPCASTSLNRWSWSGVLQLHLY